MTISRIACRKTLFLLAGFSFILLFFLPVSVVAQSPVDLTFKEKGVFPWSVTGILPGDHGSTFIDLHNNGTESGIVYIWVTNISSTDRDGNPGGGLARYMLFNVSHHHLKSTIILPARINSFPRAPLLPDNFIIIDSFKAGDTIRLNWTWEFEETGQPQNDAQNNTLQFNLLYTLVNLSAPAIPTPVPTGIQPGSPGGGGVMPQNPSIFEAGGIPGLIPAQRPQLRAPEEEPPETESGQPDFPECWHIMTIGLIAIVFIISVLLLWKRKKDAK